MKLVYKFFIVLLSLVSVSAFAQTLNIPVPASSTNGSRAVVAITMPVVPTYQDIANISYNTVVPYIPTTATIAGIAYNTVVPLIPNQSGGFCGFATYSGSTLYSAYSCGGVAIVQSTYYCNGYGCFYGPTVVCPGGYGPETLSEGSSHFDPGLGTNGATVVDSYPTYTCVKA